MDESNNIRIKNMKKIYYFLVLNIVIMSFACSKEDDATPTMTNTKLLTRSWMYQKTHVSIPSLGYESTFYDRDDVEFLYTMYDSHYDRVLYHEDGTFLSNGEWNVELTDGTWEFNHDETQIISNKGTSAETVMHIMQLTEREFTYKSYEVEDGDTVSIYTVHMIPEYQ